MKIHKLNNRYLSVKCPLFIAAILITLISQSCVTMSKGEKERVDLANFAKENKGCCVEKVYLGANIILNRNNEIEIASVVGDSPLNKAGFLRGDIIFKIDGDEIKTKYQAFKIYDSKYPGDEMELTVKRKNEIITKSIKLTSFYMFNIMYLLTELIYKDVPIRLAIIPGKINLISPDETKAFDKYAAYFVGMFESGFITGFRGHNNFAIIDRQKTDSILNELKFQESGLVDNTTRVKLGKMLGATHLMTIDLLSYISEANTIDTLTTLRIIEIETGKNLSTSSFKVKSQEPVDLVQIDLIDYWNSKLMKIFDLEKVAMTSYNDIRQDLFKEESINILTNKVIPIYGKFLEGLKNNPPNTKEVNKVHKLYIESATLMYEALGDIETSAKQKNSMQLKQASGKIEEANEKMKQYIDALQKLREKHKTTIKN
jgi:hypothetical protein